MARARFGNVCEGSRAIRVARVWRPHFDPCFQAGDLLIRKFFVFRRHLQIRISIADRFDEQARVGIPRDDDWAGVTALKECLASIEAQTAFDFLGRLAMAPIAVFAEQRPDLFFEEIDLLEGRSRAICQQRNQEGRKNENVSARKRTFRREKVPATRSPEEKPAECHTLSFE